VLVALLSLAALLLGPGTATADVVLLPDRVDPGARDVTLVFRLTDTDPDPAARTVRLQVFLPTGRPLVGVDAPAPPGWTARLSGETLAAPAPSVDGPVAEIVTMIEWTAPAAGPAPASVDLPVRAALMPDGAGPVRFRVLRTAADGRTEEWANSWTEGGPKPAHDALLVRLGNAPPPVLAAPHGDHHGEGAAVAAEPLTPASAGSVATTLTTLLLVAAALAGLVAALARHQRRRFAEMSEKAVLRPDDSHFDDFAERPTPEGVRESR
jgi:hypothetical protein